MSGGLSQRLERVARDHVPIAITIFLAVFSTAPFYIPGYGMVAANLALMGVFYWSVHRPDLLSPVAAFCIGLLYDFLAGTPPGMTALIFVVVRGLTGAQGGSLAGKPFLFLWLGFWGAAAGAGVTAWIISAVWHAALLDPAPLLFQVGLTIALFPFVSWLLVWIQHKLLPV